MGAGFLTEASLVRPRVGATQRDMGGLRYWLETIAQDCGFYRAPHGPWVAVTAHNNALLSCKLRSGQDAISNKTLGRKSKN